MWCPVLMLTFLCLWATPVFGARDASHAAEHFQRGVQLIDRFAWSEALEAFTRSAALRPTSISYFNMGYCERALGHYTRAQAHFERALTLNPEHRTNRLSERDIKDVQIYLQEARRLLAHVTITVHPADARIAVDSRPLAPSSAEGRTTAVAGTHDAGAALPAPAASFELIIDPGPHVFTLSRPGYKDLFRNEVVVASSRSDLRFHLEPPIYKRWWFWVSGAAAVGTAVALSLGLGLSPPPYDGGSTGWVVRGQAPSALLVGR